MKRLKVLAKASRLLRYRCATSLLLPSDWQHRHIDTSRLQCIRPVSFAKARAKFLVPRFCHAPWSYASLPHPQLLCLLVTYLLWSVFHSHPPLLHFKGACWHPRASPIHVYLRYARYGWLVFSGCLEKRQPLHICGATGDALLCPTPLVAHPSAPPVSPNLLARCYSNPLTI